jgi:hypothetical protein
VRGEEQKLVERFRALNAEQQALLNEFAEFLAQRAASAAPRMIAPRHEPRPENETVVKAIQRLARTYPMLDRRKLLAETSRCVEQHVIHGRDANEVITELELIFDQHYTRIKARNSEP